MSSLFPEIGESNARRGSTARSSGVIVLLEMGRIIKRGSHGELIAQQGRCPRLYTGAFELE